MHPKAKRPANGPALLALGAIGGGAAWLSSGGAHWLLPPAWSITLLTAGVGAGWLWWNRRTRQDSTPPAYPYCPLHALFENSADLIQSVNGQGRFTFVNSAWYQTLGYTPEELPGLDIFQVIHPDHHEHCRQILARSARGEAVGLVEVAFRKKNGARVELEGRMLLHQEPGQLPVSQGVFRDITQRKEAERNLERFFNVAQEGMCISNFEGDLLRVNPALAGGLGYTPEEFLTLPRLAAVHPEDVPILEAALARLRAGETTARFEVRTRNRQGDWRLWSWKCVGVMDQRLIYSSGQDVTELRQATEALRKSEAEARKLALVADRTVNGVILTDATGRVEWVNEGFTRLTGYTLEEVRGKRPGRLLQGAKSDPASIQLMQEKLRKKAAFEVELINYSKQGIAYWVSVQVQPLFNERGILTHFMGLQFDITERKQAEAEIRRLNDQLARRVQEQNIELHESNRRLQALMANLQGMVYRCRYDDGWKKDFVSEGCRRLLGIAPEELTSQRVKYKDLIHPEDQARVEAEVQASLDRKAPFVLEYRVKHADGSWRWVWEQGHGVADAQQRLTVQEGYIMDVTERRAAADALKHSESRYRTMFEDNHVPMLILEPETGRIADANPAACTFYGWEHERLTTMFITDLNTWSPEEVMLEMQEAKASRRNYFSFHHRRADGSVRNVEVVSGPIQLDGQQRLLSIITDVTERKQAEIRVQESEERLRQITHSIRDAVWLRDARTRQILFVNRAYEVLTGQTCEDFYKDPDALIHCVAPEAVKPVWDGREAALRGEIFDLEHRIIRADQQERWVRGRTFPVRNQYGEVYRLVSVWSDITERVQQEQTRRNLEEQLRQVQKMEAIGQLAGGVAHDFNNILAVIQMQIDLMRTEPDATESQKAYGEEILQATMRATGLTRQLLMFSRRQVLQPRPLVLNEVVTNLMKMLSRILGEDIHIQVAPHSEPVWIHADAGMMDQVLMNLVVNARDAMPTGGQLAIATQLVTVTEAMQAKHPAARCGQFACLSVTDTGCGISPENLQRIFEPFFTTKGVGKGTGLGLATVFGIVQQHAGWVEVTSEVGRGTTFKVFLPAQSSAASSVNAAPPAAIPRGGQETILLVEDETALRTLLARVLRHQGYRVLEAENGLKAKHLWSAQPNDIKLLLTDLVMPGGVSGRDLARQLQAQQPGLKVVYITGYSPEATGDHLIFEEGVNFLFKPFDTSKLAELIRKQFSS